MRGSLFWLTLAVSDEVFQRFLAIIYFWVADAAVRYVENISIYTVKTNKMLTNRPLIYSKCSFFDFKKFITKRP